MNESNNFSNFFDPNFVLDNLSKLSENEYDILIERQKILLNSLIENKVDKREVEMVSKYLDFLIKNKPGCENEQTK